MKPLRVKCDRQGCTKAATSEVFNDRNASLGRFCQPDAIQKLKDVSVKKEKYSDG